VWQSRLWGSGLSIVAKSQTCSSVQGYVEAQTWVGRAHRERHRQALIAITTEGRLDTGLVELQRC
jgi:hypothetical protein